MQNLSQTEFSRLVDDARVLEADSRGPRVYLTAENKVVKLFPGKGLFSSNTLYAQYAIHLFVSPLV